MVYDIMETGHFLPERNAIRTGRKAALERWPEGGKYGKGIVCEKSQQSRSV